jgi:hypothetical protein
MLLFQSDQKEYNRIARAINKNGVMGITGLAQKSSITNQNFHFALRYCWHQIKRNTVYGKTTDERRDEIVNVVHLLLGKSRDPKGETLKQQWTSREVRHGETIVGQRAGLSIAIYNGNRTAYSDPDPTLGELVCVIQKFHEVSVIVITHEGLTGYGLNFRQKSGKRSVLLSVSRPAIVNVGRYGE